jgi:hypothetical protein
VWQEAPAAAEVMEILVRREQPVKEMRVDMVAETSAEAAAAQEAQERLPPVVLADIPAQAAQDRQVLLLEPVSLTPEAVVVDQQTPL